MQVAVRIAGVGFKHAEITKCLGRPTSCHLADEISILGRPYGMDQWLLKSPLPKAADINKHLRWLERRLRPHMAFLRRLRRAGAVIDVVYGISVHRDQEGFELAPDVTLFLGELGAPLGVFIYVPTGVMAPYRKRPPKKSKRPRGAKKTRQKRR